MFRNLTRFWLVWALLLCGVGRSFGFALLGPFNEAYQVTAIGYNLSPLQGNDRTDVGAPKNKFQGYRWNTGNVYYAFDRNAQQFLGDPGMAAVDSAFSMLNSLSNVNSYSASLSEWPLESSRVNFNAAALDLLDVKSRVLSTLLEELGLDQPVRWTWCLHDREVPAGAVCPNFEYTVIQRNYDPITGSYSSFVNGTMFDFAIGDTCLDNPNPFAPLLADAVEVQVDPISTTYTAVAEGILPLGGFYTSLSRDDIGGLRALWGTNVINTESVDPNSLLIVSNIPTLITTSNLTTLMAATQTNNPTQLQALFPTLQFTNQFLYFSNVVTTNITAFFTNLPGSQVGSPATLVQSVTVTINPVPIPIYSYTFLNIITNFVYTNFGVPVTNQPGSQGFVTVLQSVVSAPIGGQVGAPLVTNTLPPVNVVSNFVTGEYFVIPTNGCGYTILSNVFTQVIATTNVTAVTNAATNVGSFSIVTYFTNHTLAVSIPSCQAGTVSLREGIGKINFFRVDFDSFAGQTFTPVTNTYSLTAVTNHAPITQNFYRVVTTPDILFTASDLSAGPAALIDGTVNTRTVPTFNQANILPGEAGPGTIQPEGVVFTFNNVGPIFLIEPGTSFTDTQPPIFQWASFDGTTNAPVLYPNSVTLASLANGIFLSITLSGPMPDGKFGQPYSFQLPASGALPPPYTWAMSSLLPTQPPPAQPAPGLTLSTTTGVISGTPTQTGIFDFVVQVSDSAGHSSQRQLQIQIDP
jgi:hypothetical protein